MRKQIFIILFFVSLGFVILYTNPFKKLIFNPSVVSQKVISQKVVDIQFINQQIWNSQKVFNNLLVGGLSALAHDNKKNIFLAISDDYGDKNKPKNFSKKYNHKHPSRFYELKLSQNKKNKHYKFTLIKQVFLQKKIIDTEGIDFLNSDKIFISSEGGLLFNNRVLPAISLFNIKGKWLSNLNLPNMFKQNKFVQKDKFVQKNKLKGIKPNKGFESLSVDPKKKYLWFATENSIYQDLSGIKNTELIRLNRFNIKTNKMDRQFIYSMDSSITKNNFIGINGLTDILSLGDKKFITIERAFLKNYLKQGSLKKGKAIVRLFLTDCSLAQNVFYKKSLNNKIISCIKKEIINLDSVVKTTIDNIEGIALGPKVAPHKYLLVLVSDNNFSASQETQFWFFYITFL